MKKALSVILVFTLIFLSVSVFAFAENDPKSIPFIFIHGMNGYGENSPKAEKSPYWGKDDVDLLNYLRDEGYRAYAPTIGPVSSSWDRACELFAQLTGTVVDYGEAHSAKYGHDRYGRDYTGKATMGEAWDMSSKLNLISHSLGGPTARIFVSLLAYGSEEELAVNQENISPLFEGGHDNVINAYVTLAAPHNGTQLADALLNTGLVPVAVIAVAMFAKNMVNDFFMLEHWNIVDENGRLSLANAMKLTKGDNCGDDITLEGAKRITAQYAIPDSILYITYSATTTREGITGHQTGMPADGVYTLTSSLISLAARFEYDGVVPGKEWESNDGLVPVISSRYPFDDSMGMAEHKDGEALSRGVWNVMPTFIGTHSYYTGAFGGSDDFTAFFDNIFDLVIKNS